MDHPYPLGTVLFYASSSYQAIPKQCPDCLGTAKWRCILPNGEEFTIECPRCYHGGDTRSNGIVKYEDYDTVPVVTTATVTGIELGDDGKITYKFGSGYGDSSNLFTTYETALTAAKVAAESHRQYMLQQAVESWNSRARPKEGERFSPAHTLKYCRERIRNAKKDIIEYTAYAKRCGIDLE